MNIKKIPFSDELLREIAITYGTPFHIYDEKGMKDNIKKIPKSIFVARRF